MSVRKSSFAQPTPPHSYAARLRPPVEERGRVGECQSKREGASACISSLLHRRHIATDAAQFSDADIARRLDSLSYQLAHSPRPPRFTVLTHPRSRLPRLFRSLAFNFLTRSFFALLILRDLRLLLKLSLTFSYFFSFFLLIHFFHRSI
jgi:hypothetical protein